MKIRKRIVMKTFALTMLVAASAILMSCSKSDDINTTKATLSEAEIPTEIKNYIATHFPSNTIIEAVVDSDDNVITYEIILSGTVELEFNHVYQIMDIDANAKLPNSVIPQAILDYVAANYPDNYITDWELEDNHQQVELNNGLELEFDMTGVFIRIDNDGEDDETILSEAEIPAEIKNYIAAHFPSNTILKAIVDSDDNVITYEIILSGTVELEFNHVYQIMDIDANAKLPNSVIPQAILDYVAANYPDNYITDWELEDNHQQVELNNGLELEFDMTGVFIRIDDD